MVGFKNRYMVMEVVVDPDKEFARAKPIVLSKFNVFQAIRDSILTNFGECGLASSINSLQVKNVNEYTNVCIIRSSRDEYEKVWAAMTMIKSIGPCKVVFNLLNLSGSIKACIKAALKCEELKFEIYKLEVKNNNEDDVPGYMQNNLDKIRAMER